MLYSFFQWFTDMYIASVNVQNREDGEGREGQLINLIYAILCFMLRLLRFF